MKTADLKQNEDELSNGELPEGWLRTRLGEVVWPSKEKIEPEQEPEARYLGLEHIESRTSKILGHGHASDVKSTKAVFRAGDVLYGKLRPYLSKVCVPDFAGVCSTDFLVFAKKPSLNSKFLLWFLLTPEVVEYSNHHSTGVELPRISYAALTSLDFLIPPVDEQNRIVAQVEKCLGWVNSARNHLSRVPAILKRFRQAVLAAACSGRLTEDWREQHFPTNEAVNQQLGRLRHERQRLFKDGQRNCHPTSPNANFEAEAPEGWLTVSLDELCIRITSGSRDWTRYYRDDGPGTFIMAQNVRPLFFDTSYRLRVAPPSDDRDRDRSQVKRGDILVTIVGANTGDVCRVADSLDQYYVCQSVALVRPVEAGISPFLELYLNSPIHGQAQFREWIYGEGRPHLSFDQLRQTAILFPPLAEQEEIGRRVNSLFSLASTIEVHLSTAASRTDKLTQSILAEAFRGELVPTEAELARREGREYEPASVLLERIKRERESQTSTKPVSKRTRPKPKLATTKG